LGSDDGWAGDEAEFDAGLAGFAGWGGSNFSTIVVTTSFSGSISATGFGSGVLFLVERIICCGSSDFASISAITAGFVGSVDTFLYSAPCGHTAEHRATQAARMLLVLVIIFFIEITSLQPHTLPQAEGDSYQKIESKKIILYNAIIALK
jgi:hypothetical protein